MLGFTYQSRHSQLLVSETQPKQGKYWLKRHRSSRIIATLNEMTGGLDHPLGASFPLCQPPWFCPCLHHLPSCSGVQLRISVCLVGKERFLISDSSNWGLRILSLLVLIGFPWVINPTQNRFLNKDEQNELIGLALGVVSSLGLGL